jgi:flagellar biosynthesis protein FlhG
LVKAVKKQKPVSLLFPNTESARSIEAIAQKLLNIAPPEKKAGLRGFVMRLTGRRGI